MDEPARSQSIMPAALPLHYGDTIHACRPADIYHMYCQSEGGGGTHLAMLAEAKAMGIFISPLVIPALYCRPLSTYSC